MKTNGNFRASGVFARGSFPQNRSVIDNQTVRRPGLTARSALNPLLPERQCPCPER